MKRKKEKKDGEEADDRDTFGISEKLKRKELSDGRERERERERERGVERCKGGKLPDYSNRGCRVRVHEALREICVLFCLLLLVDWLAPKWPASVRISTYLQIYLAIRKKSDR
jgi:hypothetical protein